MITAIDIRATTPPVPTYLTFRYSTYAYLSRLN